MRSNTRIGECEMTREETIKLARTLGRLDHVIGFMQIERAVSIELSAAESDEYTKGLNKGTIIAVNNSLDRLIAIRSDLESLTKGVTYV